MVLAAKVQVKEAESAKKELWRRGVLDYTHVVERKGECVYIPVTKKVQGFVVSSLPLKEKKRNDLEEILQRILTKKELAVFPRAHEVVGDILILEVPTELKKKEKKIADAYLEFYKSVKTVVKKSAIHSGVHRTRRVQVLAGMNNKETIYKEHGLRYKIHLEKMYFSSRLGNERLRIAQQVKNKENVLVMFSGAAPYCCVIAKYSDAHVVGIEINPDAHKYAVGNVQMNKLWDKIELYQGDVRRVLPKLKKKFDRIVMPLPKTGEEFLPLALRHIKKNGTIHYYAFLKDEEIADYKKKIMEICAKEKKNCRIVRVVKAGQHAPYVFRMCFDVTIT